MCWGLAGSLARGYVHMHSVFVRLMQPSCRHMRPCLLGVACAMPAAQRAVCVRARGCWTSKNSAETEARAVVAHVRRPPETIRDNVVVLASDIYSFGVM